MDEVLSRVMMQSVRWLRNNFFIGKLKSEFSVCTLIEQSKRQELLKGCYSGLSDMDKGKLAEKVWAIPEYKQRIILFLNQPQDLRNQKFCNNVIRRTPNFEVVKTIDLLQEPSKIIEDIERDRNNTVVGVTALFYFFENAVYESDNIKSSMTFMVGCVGKKNTKIIYEGQNTGIKTFANSIGIDCVSSEELAIND
jgi:hypothetical protein